VIKIIDIIVEESQSQKDGEFKMLLDSQWDKSCEPLRKYFADEIARINKIKRREEQNKKVTKIIRGSSYVGYR
jgi:hypothetical protein